MINTEKKNMAITLRVAGSDIDDSKMKLIDKLNSKRRLIELLAPVVGVDPRDFAYHILDAQRTVPDYTLDDQGNLIIGKSHQEKLRKQRDALDNATAEASKLLREAREKLGVFH